MNVKGFTILNPKSFFRNFSDIRPIVFIRKKVIHSRSACIYGRVQLDIARVSAANG